MNLRTELVVVVVALFVQKSLAQYPRSPCPEIFHYDQSDDGEDIGIITIKDVEYGETFLEADLSQPESIDSEYSGRLLLNFDYREGKNYIKSGTPFTYKVLFALEDVIPKIREIRLNGRKICSRKKKAPASHTKIYLQNTFNVEAPRNSPKKSKVRVTKPTTRRPSSSVYNAYDNTPKTTRLSTRRTTSSPRTTSTTTLTSLLEARLVLEDPASKPNEWSHIDENCGLENHNVQTLVVNGEDITRSRFPWIVAIFQKNRGRTLFLCGGSLISTRTVISAAHCFYGEASNLLSKENILLSMGRHEISDWTDSKTIHKDPENIIVHPEYKPSENSPDADIAIIHLKESIEFTTYIRPICMWDGVTHVNYIEGASGIIVGWGEDEHKNTVTILPKLARASVVSELTCIKSEKEKEQKNFINLTTNRTLCAGNRDGSGPCRGDSGSGLMILIRNKWRLRGIVSHGLLADNRSCDLGEYVIYADVAKFLDWIYENSVF